ncbi:lipopolysaccharide biosynthesis protein [Algoriella sp.]|uniref:lipopolysaccharide biosynthesis protein n=1 Tax=Algoriella sp. TaxID=1872434 RepID=UPI002579AA52|nr:oligosaccharide flippase family protein [Algoriella sp.]
MFLYVRMFLIMGITLYTSRIVLRELGVSDYGIYNLVGGFVAMLGFFNAAMSSATQRYLSFDIGKGDHVQLKKTFSTTLSIHIIIAAIGLLLAETIGLWYVNNKLNFPEDRMYAVNVVYQFSVFTFLLSIIQVPYNALIIARERMKIYAYVSILEAILKLLIVFFLVYFGSDKLITYAILTFCVTLLINVIYQVYCRREFQESKYHFHYDKQYFGELISYSGWNLFGNIAAIAKGQGVNIVLNLFFGTVVNAAYGITNQVLSAVNMFVSNFQLALNPQIIKSYSQGNIEQSQYLISQGSKFSFYLMLIIVSPIVLNVDFILETWLVNPPEHMTIFVQLCLLNILIDCLSGTLMTGAQATGKIKWYQIVVGTLVFLNLPISYLVLKLGYKPYSVYGVSIFISLITLQFRLYFLNNVMSFNIIKYFKEVILRVIILSIITLGLFVLLNNTQLMNQEIGDFILKSLIMIIFIVGSVLIIGLNKQERKLIFNFINKIRQ